MEKSQSGRYRQGGGMLRRTTSSSVPSMGRKREVKKIKEEEGFVRFLPRSTSRKSSSKVEEVPRRTRSASTSPSAWALSPGRTHPSSLPAPAPVAVPGRTAMSGILKYLRPNKVSPILEQEYHQFRLMYNRLLQWRFANARAAASMPTLKTAAQGKLLNGWVRVSLMRKVRMEKRIEIQKMKQDMKLCHILSSQMGMLKEWWRIEARNLEAVGRVVRKLSAVSLCLPLQHNAQADVVSVYNAISSASEVMDNIKAIIMGLYCQVEKTCFVLTELSVMLIQYKQLFQQLEKPLALVASLEAEERSLRVHHIQLMNEMNLT